MSVQDLSEGLTETETPVAVWMDDETNEIIFQYGYVSVSMPAEDYEDFLDLLQEAREGMEREE